MYRSKKACLSLSGEAQASIYRDIYTRKEIEACGLLLGTMNGTHWQATEALPLPNAVPSPVYFEFAPEDLLTAELSYPDQIIGVYHSHPTGYPRPSSTDLQNMKHVNQEQNIPWAWLIVCGPFNNQFQARAEAQQALPSAQVLAFYHFPDHGLSALALNRSLWSTPLGFSAPLNYNEKI